MSSETEQPAWFEEWARRLETLDFPMTLLFLEMAQAFGFLGGQMLLLVQPLMSSFASGARVEQAATLLNDPELLEQLKKQLAEGGG